MTIQAVQAVLDRAMSDPSFRKHLAAAPDEALAGYDLSAGERAAFATGTVAAERLEERMSKTDLSAAVSAKTASPLLRAPSQTRKP